MTQHRARKTGTVFLLLLSLLALYGHRCDYGYDQESTDEVPPDDCPSWDSDCDMISRQSKPMTPMAIFIWTRMP